MHVHVHGFISSPLHIACFGPSGGGVGLAQFSKESLADYFCCGDDCVVSVARCGVVFLKED